MNDPVAERANSVLATSHYVRERGLQLKKKNIKLAYDNRAKFSEKPNDTTASCSHTAVLAFKESE